MAHLQIEMKENIALLMESLSTLDLHFNELKCHSFGTLQGWKSQLLLFLKEHDITFSLEPATGQR